MCERDGANLVLLLLAKQQAFVFYDVKMLLPFCRSSRAVATRAGSPIVGILVTEEFARWKNSDDCNGVEMNSTVFIPYFVDVVV